MLNQYQLEDGTIKQIILNSNNTAEVTFSLWNGKLIKIIFEQYWRIKDNNSIDVDIDKVVISYDTDLINEAKKDIFDGNGSNEEAHGLKHFSFMSAWEDKALLEIVSYTVKVVEL